MGGSIYLSEFDNSTVYSPATLVVATNASGFHADYYTDGTNDEVEIQAAIDAVSALGGGRVLVKIGTYLITTPIAPKSNIILSGEGVGTIMKQTTANYIIASGSSPFNDFIVEEILFKGSATNTPTTPTRARTTSGNGTVSGVYIRGSLDSTGTYPLITNVTIRNCYFRDIYTNVTPPFLLGGITGVCKVTGCEFTNTLDGGFIFNEEVIYSNNHVKYSADNGVSISRGNLKATCTGNTFESCAYYGIWFAGYQGSSGAQYFTCTGNVIRGCGLSGITLNDGAKYGVISGNFIDKQYYRGNVDSVTDSHIYGIELEGDLSNPGSPTKLNEQILITGNVIKGAPRAAVFIRSAKNIQVSGNLIIDFGTQYLADGSTSISSSDTSQNLGIFLPNLATLTNIEVFGNSFIDSRGTPYGNYAIATLPSSLTASNNFVQGLRNSATTLTSAIMGGQSVQRTAVADTAYTATTGDYIIAYTSLSTGRTVSLPTAVGITGQVYIIKDEVGSAGTNNITVDPNGNETIDGSSTKVINSNYGVLRIVSNGANWLTI